LSVSRILMVAGALVVITIPGSDEIQDAAILCDAN
jgi:hypothetical protein